MFRTIDIVNRISRTIKQAEKTPAKPTSKRQPKVEVKSPAQQRHEERTKLGPLEASFIADSVGAHALENLGDKYLKYVQKHKGKTRLYDEMLLGIGPQAESMGRRIGLGAARIADSPTWRVLTALDPLADGGRVGLIGAAAGLGVNTPAAAAARTRAREAYSKFIKKYQDRISPDAVGTERATPWHLMQQSELADLDTDIAGHTYVRKNLPGHYYFNPVSYSGPLAELADRALRRSVSADAYPETTRGRFLSTLANIPTLGLSSILLGNKQRQDKLRASAIASGMYLPEALPEKSAAWSSGRLAALTLAGAYRDLSFA